MRIPLSTVFARLLVALAMFALIILALIAPYQAAQGNPIYYKFFSNVCHQKAHRCFEIFGFPMALCARCTFFYFGIAVGALIAPMFSEQNRRIYLILLLFSGWLVGFDVLCGYFHLYNNVFATRVATGFLAGAPLGSLLSSAIKDLLEKGRFKTSPIA